MASTINASQGPHIHDVPETQAYSTRRLRDGSTLKYTLNVIQQPKRARACGMGAKAHADRRPVDPPPCVELKVWKIENGQETDITFAYNSNFFLFATLELARPIAQGRGMGPPPPAPVLTGVTCSGLAYLERPELAGYFVFPDLSIRHEGNYRLRFALFEEPKSEPEFVECPPESDSPNDPDAYFYHRCEVKSEVFTVYSAKKFPGLAESTALSRTIAEQGCRVRIRRDVRMRRRDTRRDRDGGDETAALRAERAASPEYNQPSRKRSGSNASHAGNGDITPQAYNSDRHNSYNPANQVHPPMMPQNNYYGDMGYQQGQVPTPAPYAQQHHVQQQQPVQKPSNNPFSTQQPMYQNEQRHHVRRASGEYGYRPESDHRSIPQQQYGRAATPVNDYRQQYQPAPMPQHQAYQQPQHQHYGYQQPVPQYQTSYENHQRVTLPPLEPKWMEHGAPLPSPSYGPPMNSLQPSMIQKHIKVHQPSMRHAISPHVKSYSPHPPAPREEPASTKRQFSDVFDDSHTRGSLRNGERPTVEYDDDNDDDSDSDFSNMLFYKRADGEKVSRVFMK